MSNNLSKAPPAVRLSAAKKLQPAEKQAFYGAARRGGKNDFSLWAAMARRACRAASGARALKQPWLCVQGQSVSPPPPLSAGDAQQQQRPAAALCLPGAAPLPFPGRDEAEKQPVRRFSPGRPGGLPTPGELGGAVGPYRGRDGAPKVPLFRRAPGPPRGGRRYFSGARGRCLWYTHDRK